MNLTALLAGFVGALIGAATTVAILRILPTERPASPDAGPDFDDLIARSSLGTPDALHLRAQTPRDVRDEILVAGDPAFNLEDLTAALHRIVNSDQLPEIRRLLNACDITAARRLIRDTLA